MRLNMNKTIINNIIACFLALFLFSCASKPVQLTIDSDSVVPGTQVKKQGQPLPLLGTPIKVGQPLPVTSLVDAQSMKSVDLRAEKGSVLFISIVPSIDTKVCEEQTHYLGEEGDKLPATIRRITISRDTHFAQRRFAEEADLDDVQYLSDYKAGDFGKSVGILMDGPMLLARSVILVDKQGIVQYIQVVPEITHLPDMEKAFSVATELARQP
jgi:thiol peroxidase